MASGAVRAAVQRLGSALANDVDETQPDVTAGLRAGRRTPASLTQDPQEVRS